MIWSLNRKVDICLIFGQGGQGQSRKFGLTFHYCSWVHFHPSYLFSCLKLWTNFVQLFFGLRSTDLTFLSNVLGFLPLRPRLCSVEGDQTQFVSRLVPLVILLLFFDSLYIDFKIHQQPNMLFIVYHFSPFTMFQFYFWMLKYYIILDKTLMWNNATWSWCLI